MAVVLYKTMDVFTEMEYDHMGIKAVDYVKAVGSFFSVAFGGLFIGMLVGFITGKDLKFYSDFQYEK